MAKGEQKILFGIIAHLITQLSGPGLAWTSRDRIRIALENDPEARKIVLEAKKNSRLSDPIGNMIDWFSARFESAGYSSHFERSRGRDGKWQYRPSGNLFVENEIENTGIDNTKISHSKVFAHEDIPGQWSSHRLDWSKRQENIHEGMDHLRSFIQDNLEQLEQGLVLVDQNPEDFSMNTNADLIAKDRNGTIVLIWIKTGKPPYGFSEDIGCEMTRLRSHIGKPIRGIVIAAGFAENFRLAAKNIPDLAIKVYQPHYSFEPVK